MKPLLITAIILIALCTCLVFIGALFKLQHWPGASVLLTTGLVGQVAGILFLATYFIVKVAKRKVI